MSTLPAPPASAVRTATRWTAVGGFVLFALLPVYWLLVLSLYPPRAASNVGLLPPADPTLLSYQWTVFGTVFLRFLANSLVVATLTTLVVLCFAIPIAYALARLDFPGKSLVALAVLLVSFFPPVATFLPLFRLFTGQVAILGVHSPSVFNTPVPMVFSIGGLRLPLATFVLAAYFRAIPEDLEAAARIAGCTRLGALWRVVLPLSRPALAAAAILTFISTYNEFFFSFLMNDSQPEHWATVVYGLRELREFAPALAAAGSILALVPVFVVVLAAGDHLEAGAMEGALR